MTIARIMAALITAAAAMMMSAEAAQVDYFLKIRGVEGDARADGHDKWIEINSVSFALDPEAGAVAFGDGVTGRRLPAGDGDPDRPVIAGSVPNPPSAAQQSERELAFVMRRFSKATRMLMQYCADGKHIESAEIHELHDGALAITRTYHDLRFVSFEVDDKRIEPGADGKRVARTLNARALSSDPKIAMRYSCMEWEDARTGEKSAPCPAAKDGTITIKGKKIREN